jgi:5-methylcytosine-specific restriction endonuclease McrBC regulatory subunit McrC
MMLSSPSMVLLFMSYLSATHFSRINMNANMSRYRDAYVEACFIMMQLNPSRHAMS